EFFEEFPSSRFKRLRRQRIELEKDLVDAKIAVCNIKLGQADIVTKQTIYSELGRRYEKIAGLSNELGYTQEALRYFDLAQANYELLTKECEGIFPAETQKKKARLYMNECVYPLAQKHYAKLLDPQKALRLAVYYKHTEQTNLEDFFLGIFFDSFKEVLPEYVGCRLLLKDEGQELIEEMRRKTIQWLETCKNTIKEWVMKGCLTSDDEGVVTVEVIENGRKEKKELLDIIAEAENKKDKNKGRTHAIKKESNDKASSPANSPEPKLIGELTSNEVRGGAFFSPIEPILYSSYIVRTSSSPVLANSEASRIMEEAFKNGLSIWRKFKLAQYRYVGLDNIAIDLKYFKDEALLSQEECGMFYAALHNGLFDVNDFMMTIIPRLEIKPSGLCGRVSKEIVIILRRRNARARVLGGKVWVNGKWRCHGIAAYKDGKTIMALDATLKQYYPGRYRFHDTLCSYCRFTQFYPYHEA
ncbi:MAG: hypothetical protein KAR32_06955, partial [Candidatus Omnitrophica bacterium]|nr:hypothetical protein [Candidatus Omnitrophota bacterium]